MHERSLALALWKEVERVVATECARRGIAGPTAATLTIDEVRVQVGPLSGVEPILLANAFADLAAEGVVANVRLTLEPVEFVVRCDACGKTTASSEPQFRCRACGGLRVTVMQGDGLVLESVSLMQSVAEPAGEGARRA